MNKTRMINSKKKLSSTSSVLIDATNPSYIISLRDYFFSSGSNVVVNQTIAELVDYHVIYGSPSYVKQILELRNVMTAKRLVITWGSEKAITKIPDYKNLHIIVTDPKKITKKEAAIMIQHFFSSKKKLLYLKNVNKQKYRKFWFPPFLNRKKNISRIDHSRNESPLNKEDEMRISNLISSSYRNTKLRGYLDKKGKKIKKIIKFPSYNIKLTVLLPLILLMSYVILIMFTTLLVMINGFLIQKQLYKTAKHTINISNSFTNTTTNLTDGISEVLTVIHVEPIFRPIERVVSTLVLIQRAEYSIINIYQTGNILSKSILAALSQASNTTDVGVASSIASLNDELGIFQTTIGLLQTELASLSHTFPFTLIKSKIDQSLILLSTKVSSINTQIQYVKNFLHLYSKAAGFKDEMKYLVLFQNSMELRPTGGFIGSVALVTMDDGYITSFDIVDVYTLDGQLKGHVDPPDAIGDLLNQEHWYLRDSNWDPSFELSAKQALWFYEKEANSKIDGVFAVNSTIIQTLLTIIGPIDMPDYNDQITAENFYGKSLHYTQSDFFPGSTQKRDFLSALYRRIIEQVLAQKDALSEDLVVALSASFRERDIQLYFDNSQLQRSVELLGWGGKLQNTDLCALKLKGQDNCIYDYLYPVEANLGVNKANIFITRSSKHTVALSESGVIEEHIVFDYANKAQISNGRNNYKAYMQLLVSSDIKNVSIMLDGELLPYYDENTKLEQKPPYMRVQSYSNDLTSLEVAFVVKEGDGGLVEIFFNRVSPLAFDQQNRAYYYGLIQSQPGQTQTQHEIVIQFPRTWKANNMTSRKENQSSTFLAKEHQLKYNTTLSQDFVTHVLFTR